MLAAIAVAVAGVLIMTTKPGQARSMLADLRPATLGLLAGLAFGLSAIGFRGAITALPDGSFLIRALTILALALALQTIALGAWLALKDRAALTGSGKASCPPWPRVSSGRWPRPSGSPASRSPPQPTSAPLPSSRSCWPSFSPALPSASAPPPDN